MFCKEEKYYKTMQRKIDSCKSSCSERIKSKTYKTIKVIEGVSYSNVTQIGKPNTTHTNIEIKRVISSIQNTLTAMANCLNKIDVKIINRYRNEMEQDYKNQIGNFQK